jgi:hypothetical protein
VKAGAYFLALALLRLLEDKHRIPLFHGEKHQKRLFRLVAGQNPTLQVVDLI